MRTSASRCTTARARRETKPTMAPKTRMNETSIAERILPWSLSRTGIPPFFLEGRSRRDPSALGVHDVLRSCHCKGEAIFGQVLRAKGSLRRSPGPRSLLREVLLMVLCYHGKNGRQGGEGDRRRAGGPRKNLAPGRGAFAGVRPGRAFRSGRSLGGGERRRGAFLRRGSGREPGVRPEGLGAPGSRPPRARSAPLGPSPFAGLGGGRGPDDPAALGVGRGGGRSFSSWRRSEGRFFGARSSGGGSSALGSPGRRRSGSGTF